MKLCLAGMLAFMLLNLFSIFYYCPVTRVNQPNGATQYSRIPNRLHTHCREGHGAGLKNGGLKQVDGYYPIMDLSKFWCLTAFFVEVGCTLGLAYVGNNPFIYFQF